MSDHGPMSSGACEVSERLSSAFVLVLDDDDDSRFAAEAIYRQWGCRVLAIESPERAFDALTEHLRSPDLIVSDYQLSADWTGVRAVETLRARAESLIPAIILTGDVGALQSVRLDLSFAVLQKPAGAERLKQTSERLLSLGLPDMPRDAVNENASDSARSEAKA